MTERSVRVSNTLTYKAVVEKKFDSERRFEGYHIILIRYTYDARTPLTTHESYYWAPDGTWTAFPSGGAVPSIAIPLSSWPEEARKLVAQVAEPEAAQVLSGAIEEAGVEARRVLLNNTTADTCTDWILEDEVKCKIIAFACIGLGGEDQWYAYLSGS